MQTISIEELLAQTPRFSVLPMHQIWAECIFLGKDIENRNRRIRKRGTILVYACIEQKGLKDSLRIINERPALRSILREGLPLTFGALLGAVDIVDCSDNTQSDEWVGDWGMPRSWHWHLSNPRRLVEPIAYRPLSQGWFFVSVDTVIEQQRSDARSITADAHC